ncbi:MCE family protein [Nocardia cyriacigeorgica]|uniref:MCE family protein n=1 Tax=Nocardia cyriacigeorgica TaxID=135487 RepID=A0A5R8PAF8_9NOCA|nr:MlaD family protein [Nocardia cyriacigeorgica]TLG05292.1 MCE family protein [Nocardia cyriacigeorgica]
MRRFLQYLRPGAYALFAATIAVAATGCGFQPADIAVPGAGAGGPTYNLRIEFADVLNLPQGAKVIADGVPVGRLNGVTVVDAVGDVPTQPGHRGFVIADVAIRESVRLPVGTTAELRQETPLGDVHIALTEPAEPAAAKLPPGATIPLADTTQSPPIEDILSRLSTFVGSGAVTDFQDIVRRMNTIMPRNPDDTARIAATLGADLEDLAANTDAIHELVRGLRSTVDEGLLKNAPALDQLLTPDGVQHTTDVINTTIGVVYVLTALGPLAPSATWLGPALQSSSRALRAVVPMLFGSHPFDTSSPSNLKKLVELIQNKIIPFMDRGPKVNLVGITVDSPPATAALPPQQQTDRIIDTLRMIGVVR